ncbi:hypothetical protein IQ07DRAFT_4991 [Pyrenochaeta sp. DS3sAY3a]|nr:hypothetical protein IQ07DRAFT_4991 [Pyrenochaeta sp. DS3sAY3a]
MDFSNSAFRSSAPASKISNDTMSHTNLVMSCRWGWTSTPEPESNAHNPFSPPPQTQGAPTSSSNNIRQKRFAPCQGRFYHQLQCSHRIRTDMVEDCGSNCIEPLGHVDTAFLCNECIRNEAAKIWELRKTQYNGQYPPLDQMTKEVYDQWYLGYRQIEAEFARDHDVYKQELMAKTRPSNICSTVQLSKEEMDFAAELDSLSLSLMNSNSSTVEQQRLQPSERRRISLMNDASEQLHWSLTNLSLDRGSCGIEYAVPSPIHEPSRRHIDEEKLWHEPRASD